MTPRPALVVLGGASLDILHFHGRVDLSAGGAGLYTALAAHRAGARVTMLAPHPDPMPGELAEAAFRLDWRGPRVDSKQLPTFEIVHKGEGVTEMRNVWWRAEADFFGLDPPADLPPGWVYCIPLTDPERQAVFVRHAASLGRVTASGAFLGAVEKKTQRVLEVFDDVDVFFCNEAEAAALFGAGGGWRTEPGKLLYVTRGPEGVSVVQGDLVTEVPGERVREVDPTGAGDTFAGTVLAKLAAGEHPVAAAREGVAAAAEMVTRVGPRALLEAPPSPSPARDGRAVVDAGRVGRMAGRLRELAEVEPFDFTGGPFPPEGHSRALDFFFAATLQQFGFWTHAAGRYREPMVGVLLDRSLKGSDYLWAVYRRWLDRMPEGLTPFGQATLEPGELTVRFAADDGENPLPRAEERLRLARSYGRDLLALGVEPPDLLARANADDRPVRTLLADLSHVGGYKEDPLRKKASLLALILRQRPEGFLRQVEGDPVPPVIDYHLQRSCLRMGLVRLTDEELEGRLERRELVPEPDERAVREACWEAMSALVEEEGLEMGAVDRFFFENRTRCPEMTEPECERCPVEEVCAQAKELFQPVRRTTSY